MSKGVGMSRSGWVCSGVGMFRSGYVHAWVCPGVGGYFQGWECPGDGYSPPGNGHLVASAAWVQLASGQYASYWNAFLFCIFLSLFVQHIISLIFCYFT